jgi:hypothetical protein
MSALVLGCVKRGDEQIAEKRIPFASGDSVPEVIQDGVTGFIVKDEEQAIAAVHKLDQLDRRRVRAVFEQRLSASQMAREYEREYQKLLAVAAQGLPLKTIVSAPLTTLR